MNVKLIAWSLICYLLMLPFLNSQETTIGLQFFDENVSDGYVLFSPDRATYAYLVNSCGQAVHEWSGNSVPQFSNHLLEDGSMIRMAGDFIERKSWDDELLWRYNVNDDNTTFHHDFEPLPNGNVLMIAYDSYTSEEAIELGRLPDTLDDETAMSEKVLEIRPIDTDSFEIVWEWKLWDHLIQDVDPNKPNFGNIQEHPERLNINYEDSFGNGMYDWMHFNGIDYNPDLDQILLSSRHSCEIYIIDHSTTTEQAASSIGGNTNKGGDFLWRWGNPKMYDAGSTEDKQLFGQHDPQWILSGLPDEGKISVFSNNPNDYPVKSNVHILDAGLDGAYMLNNSNQFLPMDFTWSYTDDILGVPLGSDIKSGIQIVQNGNKLITEGITGRMIEIDQDGEVVWVYTCPVGEGIPEQFFSRGAQVFKATKYPLDYPAFADKDLSNGAAILEDVNPVSDECINSLINSNILTKQVTIKIYPTVSSDQIYVESNEKIQQLELYDFNGMKLLEVKDQSKVDVSSLLPGTYLLQVYTNKAKNNFRIVVI